MGSEFRQDLIEELRELARRGERPCAMVEMLGKRLGAEGTSYRFFAIIHFREAFALALPEASLVGAAFELDKGLRTRDELDAELSELIAKHRPQWDR
jgi:hypothetical protein